MARADMLLVEDDAALAELLIYTFKREDFSVRHTPDGEEALIMAQESAPDIVLLDWMVESLSGIEVCRRLRRATDTANVPIIMLTARGEEEDRVRGLETGADDYVTKPFSVGELVARIRAIFRRTQRAPEAAQTFKIGDVSINLATHSLQRGDQVESLSFYEVELLRLLHERIGQPVSRDEILNRIWGLEASPTNRTIDNFIVKLRRKIERSPDKPEHILTVYGFGYKLA